MTYTVTFHNVGRFRLSWEATTTDLSPQWFQSEISRMNALGSTHYFLSHAIPDLSGRISIESLTVGRFSVTLVQPKPKGVPS